MCVYFFFKEMERETSTKMSNYRLQFIYCVVDRSIYLYRYAVQGD